MPTAAPFTAADLVRESGRRAGLAEDRLAAAGLRSVHVFAGGVAGWEARGLMLARLPHNARPRPACDLPDVVATITEPTEAPA
ncbi:MAG TPA: hypothetical protein VFI47_17005 [Acidimicrobiales bacterium]|nr:hypothetical protein [Acidimicrobiales bacterium]